jgi:lysophospholipase L1-like esterase
VLTRKLPVTVKDLFVVSIGDSYASGEGNPDVYGEYTGLGFRVPGKPAAQWRNEPCHRSAWSGHAVAAKELSKDRHTGLNFLSLACTGAEAKHLVYEAKGSAQPQMSVLRRTLCEWEPCRPIDLLTVSIGGNDIGFAAVAEACVINTSPHASCTAALGRAEQTVGTLVTRIRSVQQAIQDSGLTVRRVLLVGYPARIFEGGSVCAGHSARLVQLGNRMNREQQRAVDSLRAQRWHYVTGVTEAFAGKGYCSTASLFRRPVESNTIQGDTDGTAHPNKAGHRAIAARIVATYRAILRSQGTGGVLAR